MSPNSSKSELRQVNYRLPPDLIAYVERWHAATNMDREVIVATMLRAYKDEVGEPPPPIVMPAMGKGRRHRPKSE